MRLFVAIHIPHAEQLVLHGLQAGLTGGRRVAPDLFHITLAFLGDNVTSDEAEDLDDALRRLRGNVPLVQLQGIGHFGHGLPRSIWVGVGPKGVLDPLHRQITSAARRVGLSVPRRRFVPHVTLARYTQGDPAAVDDLARIIERPGPAKRQPFQVRAVHLMHSHLGRHGPDYETLASYPLI